MFTKGEWKISGSGKRIVVRDKGYIIPIAEIYGTNEQAKANAHLIASAPDLYEACKEALECLDTDVLAIEPQSEMHNLFKQALAKAEGK